MQTNNKTTATKVKSKEKSTKDDISATITKKTHEDKLKKSVYSVSTPRNFVQKSSTADIYAHKKIGVQATKTPKKVPGTTNKSSDVSPMKNLLRSSPSSVSQISTSTKIKNGPITKNDAKTSNAANHATPRTARDLPFVNVTVNSPVLKKKLNQDGGKRYETNGGKALEEVNKKSSKVNSKDVEEGQRSKNGGKRYEKNGGKALEEVNKKNSKVDSKDVEERQRSKTRTLNENEIKVLTSVEGVDNNAEMQNLSRKLTAKPKAFYVELDESKNEPQNDKASEDDDVSYEDDFESYESDFESYHESQTDRSEQSNERTHDTSDEQSDVENKFDSKDEKTTGTEEVSKEVKDEEKMLDSGNFDLRDSRSANKAKPMQFILEDLEPDVKSSLTDEGFQDMSCGASSIRTVHTDVLDRPLFIDFTKSKESKRKRKVFDRLQQRAKDILSMVTLHEMSYSLFEMKPIPYDLYMATFGRANYMQTAVQTFDDGVTEEIQTEEIQVEEKWTQHPVEFSNHIHLEIKKSNRKANSNNIEDYLTKFTFLISNKTDDNKNQNILEENYKSNPLRVYLEQKDGVGPTEMLPCEIYRTKLKNTDFNNGRLEKFLKKYESRIYRILNTNVSSDSIDLIKTSKYPFSQGYVAITTKYITNENIQFIKQAKIKDVVFSETKSNLIFTIHNKCLNAIENKYAICLWDISVAMREPVKILVAIDNISIARYRGSTDGVFVAALEDGSVHLWDLSEEPTWHPDINDANDEKPTDPVVVDSEALTQIERDREWNAKNSHIGFNSKSSLCLLQACAYTTSANSMHSGPCASVTGLVLEIGTIQPQEGGRRVLGQVCALQRIGIITIWSIVQEKLKKSSDIGKAYWSKMKLENKQIISLAEQMRLQSFNPVENFETTSFNLNAAKRRISLRKKEKSRKRQFSRPKSGGSFDSDRPSSAAVNQMLPVYSWVDGLVCTDLKVMRLKNNDNYLVAKNCGEVLCCTKSFGVVKINRFLVATDLSTVTCVEVSPHRLPYFLAATDAGTINLCSLTDYRVLLTLDCRNGPPNQELERYQVDTKGRFLGSTRPITAATHRPAVGVGVKSVFWCKSNPCCIIALQASGALLTWELTHSDINATSAVDNAASSATCTNNSLALLMSDSNEVQIHSLHRDQHDQQYLQLFQKYAALL